MVIPPSDVSWLCVIHSFPPLEVKTKGSKITPHIPEILFKHFLEKNQEFGCIYSLCLCGPTASHTVADVDTE